MTTEDRLRIGQAARAAGVTRKAIRLYEDRGLLREAERTASGYRLFDAEDVSTLVFIRRARAVGLHLDDVAEVLSASRCGETPCGRLLPRLDQRIEEVEKAIAGLHEVRQSLCAARDRGVDGPVSSTSTICPIIDNR